MTKIKFHRIRNPRLRGRGHWMFNAGPGHSLFHRGNWTEARQRAERWAKSIGVTDITVEPIP